MWAVISVREISRLGQVTVSWLVTNVSMGNWPAQNTVISITHCHGILVHDNIFIENLVILSLTDPYRYQITSSPMEGSHMTFPSKGLCVCCQMYLFHYQNECYISLAFFVTCKLP